MDVAAVGIVALGDDRQYRLAERIDLLLPRPCLRVRRLCLLRALVLRALVLRERDARQHRWRKRQRAGQQDQRGNGRPGGDFLGQGTDQG